MKQILLEPEEYINPEDGLIYCRDCGKPRQKYFRMLGHEYRPRIPCDCQAEKRREEEYRREAYERERYVDCLKEKGLGWKALRDYRFDNNRYLSPRLLTTLKEYTRLLKEPCPASLLLWGPPGIGKTYAAACIVNEVLEDCQPAAMVSYGRFLEDLSGMSLPEKQDRLDGLFSNKLVCFDDFDVRYLTRPATPTALDIANRIVLCGRPVLITTGYTLEELDHPKTELELKLFRSIRNHTVPVHMDGEDLSRKVRQEQIEALRDAL